MTQWYRFTYGDNGSVAEAPLTSVQAGWIAQRHDVEPIALPDPARRNRIFSHIVAGLAGASQDGTEGTEASHDKSSERGSSSTSVPSSGALTHVPGSPFSQPGAGRNPLQAQEVHHA